MSQYSNLSYNKNNPFNSSNAGQRKNTIKHKKIKDLHVFTHVGFDGEQDKENNQHNYFIQKKFCRS